MIGWECVIYMNWMFRIVAFIMKDYISSVCCSKWCPLEVCIFLDTTKFTSLPHIPNSGSTLEQFS